MIPGLRILLAFYDRCILQLLKRPAELVWTRGTLRPATDTIQAPYHVVDFLPSHQLGDALQITITSTQEEHLLDDIMLIGRHINKL